MLIQNAIILNSTGKIHKSWNTHDYISFEVEGSNYFIDGGNEYLRTSVPPTLTGVTWLCINDRDSVEDIMEKYVSKNADGEDTLIKNMRIEELEKVLERMQHPLVKEAVTLLISQKTSLVDVIIADD